MIFQVKKNNFSICVGVCVCFVNGVENFSSFFSVFAVIGFFLWIYIFGHFFDERRKNKKQKSMQSSEMNE